MAYAPFDLSGKVALVTGGNRGIGFGMAEALALSGAAIALWGRDAERNAQAAEELAAHGGKVKAYAVDVADEQAVVAAMKQTAADFGRIDTVVANAGVGYGSPSFVDMTTETYRRVLAVNLDGVFFTLREACRHMVERARGGDKAGGSLIGIARTTDNRWLQRGGNLQVLQDPSNPAERLVLRIPPAQTELMKGIGHVDIEK
jgi:NAD(P)-dependent dehydrogenase (short-subunit alcohol dehydrogenase family)